MLASEKIDSSLTTRLQPCHPPPISASRKDDDKNRSRQVQLCPRDCHWLCYAGKGELLSLKVEVDHDNTVQTIIEEQLICLFFSMYIVTVVHVSEVQRCMHNVYERNIIPPHETPYCSLKDAPKRSYMTPVSTWTTNAQLGETYSYISSHNHERDSFWSQRWPNSWRGVTCCIVAFFLQGVITTWSSLCNELLKTVDKHYPWALLINE